MDDHPQDGTEVVAGVTSARHELLVDSGAGRTIFKTGAFKAAVRPYTGPDLRNISGGQLVTRGEQEPVVALASGRRARLTGAVGETTRNVLAVSGCVDNGQTVVFGPGGSLLTRQLIQPPVDSATRRPLPSTC